MTVALESQTPNETITLIVNVVNATTVNASAIHNGAKKLVSVEFLDNNILSATATEYPFSVTLTVKGDDHLITARGKMSDGSIIFTSSMQLGIGGIIPPPPILSGDLIKQENIRYIGSFALPRGGTNNGTRFGYGGEALTYNRFSKTLLIRGHDNEQKIAEITIPELKPFAFTGMNLAKIVQNFYDPTDGKFAAISTSRYYSKVAGLLVWRDKLITSMYHYYDASGTQKASHFVSARDLSISNDAVGPFKVGNLKTGYTSGYMTAVPNSWRDLLGTPALVGNCCIPIISRTSFGPSIFGFDPDNLGTIDPVPAVPFVYYPESNPLSEYNSTSPMFNGTTQIYGVAFPEGFRSILFFGRHGTGPFCYGSTCFPGAGQSNHAPPYVTQVWNYDANDLLLVKQGKKQPYEVRPTTWTFSMPLDSVKEVRGVAYNSDLNIIYLSQRGTDAEQVYVHAYQLK